MTLNPSESLRTLMSRPGVTIAPGAVDVLSGRVFKSAGFEMLWAGGFMSSGSQLGWPDANVITLTEHSNYVRNLVMTTGLPVLVDVDNGYGSAINVIRTVREMEMAGAAGVVIEDQVVPKRCALFPGERPIISEVEMVGKIKAALDTRHDERFVVVGRTDSFGAGKSVSEAVDRALALVGAGADGILPISKQFDNLERFATEFRKHSQATLLVAPTLFPDVTASQLDALGYKIMIEPLVGAQAAYRAIYDAGRSMLEHGSQSNLQDSIWSFKELVDLVDLDQIARWEEEYAPLGTVLKDTA
jgi:2-methylisocitrate lyase-like PEP mutase family enzyme